MGAEGAAAQAIAVKHGSSWGYMGLLRNQHFPFEFQGVGEDPEVYEMYNNLTTPGFQIDLESLEYNSVTINYPHDGEIFRLGQTIEINLSHLYSDESDASTIVVLANNEQITELDNGIRLRVSWEPDEPGIYDFQVVVRDETGRELYRSAEVDIIVQSE